VERSIVYEIQYKTKPPVFLYLSQSYNFDGWGSSHPFWKLLIKMNGWQLFQVEPDDGKLSGDPHLLTDSDSKLSELLKNGPRDLRNSFSTDMLDDDSLSPMGSSGDLFDSVSAFPEHSAPGLIGKDTMYLYLLPKLIDVL